MDQVFNRCKDRLITGPGVSGAVCTVQGPVVPEKMFFDLLESASHKENECKKKYLSQLISGGSPSAQADQEELMMATAAKIHDIHEIRKRKQELKIGITAASANRHGSGPGVLAAAKHIQNSLREIELLEQAEPALMTSIWGIQDSRMSAYVDQVLQSHVMDGQFSVHSFLSEALATNSANSFENKILKPTLESSVPLSQNSFYGKADLLDALPILKEGLTPLEITFIDELQFKMSARHKAPRDVVRKGTQAATVTLSLALFLATRGAVKLPPSLLMLTRAGLSGAALEGFIEGCVLANGPIEVGYCAQLSSGQKQKKIESSHIQWKTQDCIVHGALSLMAGGTALSQIQTVRNAQLQRLMGTYRPRFTYPKDSPLRSISNYGEHVKNHREQMKVIALKIYDENKHLFPNVSREKLIKFLDVHDEAKMDPELRKSLYAITGRGKMNSKEKIVVDAVNKRDLEVRHRFFNEEKMYKRSGEMTVEAKQMLDLERMGDLIHRTVDPGASIEFGYAMVKASVYLKKEYKTRPDLLRIIRHIESLLLQ